MSAQLTSSNASLWLANNAPHIKLLKWSGNGTSKSEFLDTRTNIQFKQPFNIIKNKIKKNPNISFGKNQIISKQEAIKWLKENASHIKIIQWNSKNGKSKFVDTNRNVEFEYKFCYVKDKLKTNPNRLFYSIDNFSQNAFQIKEIKEKIKQTNLEKYGAENPQQNKEIKEKTKQTNLEKYGVENPIQNIKIREKIRQTNLNKYGVEIPAQNKNILYKGYQTYKKRTGFEHPSKNPKTIKKILKTKGIELIDGKTRAQLAKELGISSSNFGRVVKEKGKKAALKLKNKGPTSIEVFIENVLNELGYKKDIDYVYNKQFPNSKYKYDFYLYKTKLIIECDGLYWHNNEQSRINEMYHRNKKEIYLQDGQHKFLNFWSDELCEKNEKFIKQQISEKIKQPYPDILDLYKPLRFWWANKYERLHHNSFINELDAALKGYCKIWDY